MVDTREFLEGNYISVDLVKASKTKKLFVLGEGEAEDTEFGRKLTLPVEIDTKKKIWRPNKDSISNMQHLGGNSKNWVGAEVHLRIVTMRGKECVLGVPTMNKEEVVK